MIRLPLSQHRLVWLYRLALLAAVAAISWLAFTSVSVRPAQLTSDKFNHALAFFVLAFLVDNAFPRMRFLCVKIWPLLAYGIAIEIIQRYVSRDSSWLDLVADGVGIALYWLPRKWLRQVVVGRQQLDLP
jgi:VanZ family protein